MNIDNKKAAAACELEGEMYSILRDLKLAKVMSNELVDGYFEEEELDTTTKNLAKVMLKYADAWTRVNVLHDYICQAVEKHFADEVLEDAEPVSIAASADGRSLFVRGRQMHMAPGMFAPDHILKVTV